jgi:hypothetical protein
MSKKQILDINNSLREFNKYYCQRNKTMIQEQIPLNHNRYHFLKFKGEDVYVFFKFSRDPYFLAKEGMSETINIDVVKKIASWFAQEKLYWLYFALNDGKFYKIHVKQFLENMYIETEDRSERKTKAIINLKHMKRFNDE